MARARPERRNLGSGLVFKVAHYRNLVSKKLVLSRSPQSRLSGTIESSPVCASPAGASHGGFAFHESDTPTFVVSTDGEGALRLRQSGETPRMCSSAMPRQGVLTIQGVLFCLDRVP